MFLIGAVKDGSVSMRELYEERLQTIWNSLHVDEREYRTPDDAVGVPFTIAGVESERLEIRTGSDGNTSVGINRASFGDALDYLCQHRHFENNPCLIDSNNIAASAGPLCRAARRQNGNVRCVNYILPILAAHGVVGIDGTRKNKTWLI